MLIDILSGSLTSPGAHEPMHDDVAADLFRHLPDPAVLLTASGDLVAANEAFRAVFRQTVAPRRPPWGRTEPPPFENGTRCFDAPAPDGRCFEWRESMLPDGRRLAVARDVSARVAAADETARAKSLLFATLTHELRTPLNGVIGMTALLERAPLDAANREYLKAIRSSGEHLLDLITEILDFSRLESGRIMVERRIFAPEAMAQSVAELLSTRAFEKGLEIVVQVHPDAPTAIEGDEGRIRQILFNLVGNAVKFTSEGGVAIEIAPGADAGALRFTVRDTGPGVPLDRQAVIFEAFGQADASHARLYGGAGLGLAIVRKLALALGGRAGLSSRPGAGAAFWVELPATPASMEQPTPARLDGLKVALRVENPVLARGLGYALAGLGAKAIALEAGAASVQADVLLADRNAASALTAPPPMVLLLAQEERAQLEHPARYLLKPLRRASLAAQVLAAAGRGAPTPLGREAADERSSPPLDLGLSVLLAEDNPINALLARTLLQRAGCRVVLARDGEEAVAAAEQGGFDLIFLDLRMPRMDGIAAAKRIRALPDARGRTPIVALTADAGDTEEAAARAAGMDAFVTKPISAERLAQVAGRFRTDAAASAA